MFSITALQGFIFILKEAVKAVSEKILTRKGILYWISLNKKIILPYFGTDSYFFYLLRLAILQYAGCYTDKDMIQGSSFHCLPEVYWKPVVDH